MSRASRHFLHATLIAVLIPWTVRAQQADAGTGTISGRVVEAGSQRPLGDVQVRVVGTQRGGITNDQGDYRILNIALGSVTIRVQRIGYAPATQVVSVTAGAPVQANFLLSPTAIQIDEVVVTATGESQRK